MRNILEELRLRLRAERTQARNAAAAFAAACAGNDSNAVYAAADLLASNDDGWRLAFMKVGRLKSVRPKIKRAFLPIWIESKMLSLRVGDRAVLASGLRRLLPCDYRGKRLEVFRGASANERRRRRYGFSWTTNPNVARKFAEHWKADGGVILQTVAPAEAILLIRKPQGYYDEDEVVVDPFKLKTITVFQKLS